MWAAGEGRGKRGRKVEGWAAQGRGGRGALGRAKPGLVVQTTSRAAKPGWAGAGRPPPPLATPPPPTPAPQSADNLARAPLPAGAPLSTPEAPPSAPPTTWAQTSTPIYQRTRAHVTPVLQPEGPPLLISQRNPPQAQSPPAGPQLFPATCLLIHFCKMGRAASSIHSIHPSVNECIHATDFPPHVPSMCRRP